MEKIFTLWWLVHLSLSMVCVLKHVAKLNNSEACYNGNKLFFIGGRLRSLPSDLLVELWTLIKHVLNCRTFILPLLITYMRAELFNKYGVQLQTRLYLTDSNLHNSWLQIKVKKFYLTNGS